MPYPWDNNSITYLEGLQVLTLTRLIETKLASDEGSVRRTYKDFADVVELIARHNLSRSTHAQTPCERLLENLSCMRAAANDFVLRVKSAVGHANRA